MWLIIGGITAVILTTVIAVSEAKTGTSNSGGSGGSPVGTPTFKPTIKSPAH